MLSHGTGTGSGPPDFEEIFSNFYRPVIYFFANRGFTEEECRDLTQETFLGVYKGIGRFRRDASIETWLFTIAGNIWRNELRNRKAVKRSAVEVSLASLTDEGEHLSPNAAQKRDSETASPLAHTLADERTRMLRTALEDLPPQMRRCVLLRVDQGLQYKEIAAIMQISIQTVKSQLFQAKDRLRKKLANSFANYEM